MVSGAQQLSELDVVGDGGDDGVGRLVLGWAKKQHWMPWSTYMTIFQWFVSLDRFDC